MIVVRHVETGDVQIVAALDGIDPAVWEALEAAPPTDSELAASPLALSSEGWALVPPAAVDLDGVLKLLTQNEVAAMVTSGDPDLLGLVLGMILARTPVPLASQLHANGAAAMFAKGVLTPARYAQFLAGIPPQEAP